MKHAAALLAGCALALAGCSAPAENPEPGETPLADAPESRLPEDDTTWVVELGGTRRLRIRPDGGYREWIEGPCFGSAPEEGRVKLDGDWLVLDPDRGPRRRFLLVPWGDRLYIVFERELMEFCSRVQSSEEPRKGATGTFFMREGDWARGAAGQPGLPPAWLEFLAAKPGYGRVVEVASDGTLGLSLGSDAGVQPGTKLYVWSAAGQWEEVEVVLAQPKESRARLVVEGEEIAVGARVVTRRPAR
jgi:hypothetical protein